MQKLLSTLALTALLSFGLTGCAGEEGADGRSAGSANAHFTLTAPAEGSSVTSPVAVEGTTDLAVEQVNIRILDAAGEEVVSSYGNVDADGSFSHPGLMYFMGKGDVGMVELSAEGEVGTYSINLE